MKIPVEKIRNFTIAGHTGSGKTSLCDLMLFKAGVVDRCGNVSQKTSISDYTTEEQEKLGSIYSAALNCTWNEHQFFFMDSPGYDEFIGETIAALHSCDIALIVVDGVNGLEVGTTRAWKYSTELHLPKAIFINRLDREMADFHKVLEQIQRVYGKTVCIPITMPIGKENSLSGVIRVLTDKEIPSELSADAAKYREHLMDTIAESDEELMMRYLDGKELSEEEISTGLHKAILSGLLVPVFAGSTAKDIGVTELMNNIANLFPHPLASGEIPLKDGKLTLSADGPGVAFVFKSVIDPFIGQFAFFRVLSGKFNSDSEVFNVSNGEKERFGSLFIMNGKKQEQVAEAFPGYIVAAAKLKNTSISDTLATSNIKQSLKRVITFPNPVMSYAVTAVKSGEEEKISAGLTRCCESDPTIKIERQKETRELLFSGMGDQHIGLIIKKLKTYNKVEVNLNSPKIPYRETITAEGEGHYRHKKQTGGHGQFAEVFLRICPNKEGFEFENKVVGGNIPKNFIPAVEKGVCEAMERGPLAGCVVENIKATVYDGKYHTVDSSEMAFKIAARQAFRDAMSKANPILLEPIQKVKIMIPDEYMGDITGDLNHKRGKILGMGMEEGLQVVNAEVPLVEMSRYANELRSMTQGRGSFEMQLSHYEMVPSNVAKQIIDSYKAKQEDQ